MKIVVPLIALSLACASTGCMTAYKESVGAEKVQVIQRVYLTEFNVAWQSVLDALKSSRLDVSNREGGFIQTRWTDNTSEKNLLDSFAGSDAYIKAQFRFKVTVAKGFYNGKPSVKVAIQKEQVVQRDVLEGWRPLETDLVEENTLQYRIARLIVMRLKLAKIEENKIKHEMSAPPFSEPDTESNGDEEVPTAPAPEDSEI